MTVLANQEHSWYIKSVHLIDALSDHYHRRPYRAVRFNNRPRIKENIYNRDREMIKEIRQKSKKNGMNE